MRYNFAIGIDAGTNTGLAIWDIKNQRYISVQSLMIHEALHIVDTYRDKGIIVMVEDARQVKYGTDKHKAQGAGSVKRDAKIWEDYLKDKGICFEMRRPNKVLTKWTAPQFKQRTGWQGSTNEHGRDAGCLVYQYR